MLSKGSTQQAASAEQVSSSIEEMLANIEQSLQRKIAESISTAHVGIEQLSKRLEEKSKANKATALVLDNLAQKIDQLSGNFSTIQADLQRWKAVEAECNAKNMENICQTWGTQHYQYP